ncbi:MAG: hypothetical protein TECD_00229 [Hyphomicrobiaceae bacterium hypho_1]
MTCYLIYTKLQIIAFRRESYSMITCTSNKNKRTTTFNPFIRVLILGGTWDANYLANQLYKDCRFRIITSFAGCTRYPIRPNGDVRFGSFGGSLGLQTFLKDNQIDVLVNATHPFSERISQDAITAANEVQCLYFRLCRPPWIPSVDDKWFDAINSTHAAQKIMSGSVVLLTVGKQQLAPFIKRRDVQSIVRVIEQPAEPLPDNIRVICQRPPFSVAHERQILNYYSVDTIVTKNSGSHAVAAKLIAARELDVPVIMIRRPFPQKKTDFTCVADIITKLQYQIVLSN